MRNTPINAAIVDEKIKECGITNFGKATIRQIVGLVSKVEAATGEKYVRMEMGGPGLPASQVGVDAEIAALNSGVASVYPNIDAIPSLKSEASRFIKAFINIDVDPMGCIATTGSMQGSYASFIVSGQCDKKKDTVLFIDPGFSVQKQQQIVLGHKYESFDVYNYRDEKLREKLESYLSKGNISAVIYSSPNNPAWISFNEKELQIIGELSMKYDTIIIEDLAYLAMDFRTDKGKPFEAPYQPTVANYTDNYILLISGSKIFSYAGQRIAIAAISEKLYNRPFAALQERYGMAEFGRVFVYMALYTLSSGVCHSAQYALAAMFKAASDGKLNFVEATSEYARRAEKLKKVFIKNGFHIVYDKDLDQDVSDGFFFTIGYPGFTSDDLVAELIYYGVSAISLSSTGSVQQGLRACTSTIFPHQYDVLDARLSQFKNDHPIK